MEIVPLSGAIGAEIRGIDLSVKPNDATVSAIEQAWYDHIVLLFRNQNLDLDAHTAFASCFGEIARHERPKAIRNEAAELGPSVMLVSNIRQNGKPIGSLPDGEMMFHSDTPYREHPDKATTLYAMEILSRGGNTKFANCYQAAETLPDDVKSKLASRRAIQVFEYGAVTKEGKSDRETAAGGRNRCFANTPSQAGPPLCQRTNDRGNRGPARRRKPRTAGIPVQAPVRKRNFSTNMSGVRAIW